MTAATIAPVVKLTRAPVRIAYPGTYRLPGFDRATYSIGRDVVIDEALRLPDLISVDIESAGKEGRARLDMKSVQFGTDSHATILDPRDPAQFDVIRDVVNSGRKLIFHNSTFDCPIMFLCGLLDLDTCDLVTDTLVYARLAEPGEKTSKGLGAASARHLGIGIDDPLPKILKNLGISKARWFEEFDLNTPTYTFMAATDPILTYRLAGAARADALKRITVGHPFRQNGVNGADAHVLVEREQIINRDSLRRTCRGIRADTEFADNYRHLNRGRIASQATALESAGIKPGHSASLVNWLEARDLIPADYPLTAKTKRPSGKADDLELIEDPMVEMFVSHKQDDKTDKDYLEKVLFDAALDGRIHPSVNVLGAATGRISMGGPPVHQFPPGARGILIPEDYEAVLSSGQTYYGNPDHVVTDKGLKTEKVVCNCDRSKMKGFISIDWSQIEPVLAANVAGDLPVLAGYEAGTSDLYTDIAKFANVIRKDAKVILLAQLYGEGLLKLAHDLKLITYAERLAIHSQWKKHQKAEERVSQAMVAETLGITGFLTAIDIRNRVFEPMPKTFEYMSLLRDVAQEYQMIPTISGRIIPIPSGWYEGRFSVQTHKGINFTFQGGAYDILAEAKIAINKAGLRDAVYFSMHDEIIGDASAAYDLRRIMETPPARLCELTKRTPVLRTDMAHIGERWYAS